MNYRINEKVLNNIMIFLNRVEYKGLNEVQAINEILQVLNKPEIEEKEE